MNIRCPCCQSEIEKRVIYSKSNCPVLNNVVYRTEIEARNCVVGSIRLVLCPACNFVFNAAFNKSLPLYDESYDNTRGFSATYRNYLDELTGALSKNVDETTTILEIGCGQGEFLKELCLATGARGFGYDIVYRGESQPAENVRFFREYFEPSQSQRKYDIVVLRHVLEHIPEPYRFLKEICAGNILKPEARLWVEVPDFAWILNKGVFYDITYEHCNYFVKRTLVNLSSTIGFRMTSIKNVFEEQYILLEATQTPGRVEKEESLDSPPPIFTLINRFLENRETYSSLIKNAKEVCIWGASGKGVVFLSGLTDELLENIKYVIDINPRKQGGFLPVSGKKVDSPEILKQASAKLLVLIMNGIYEEEIKNKLAEMGVSAQTHVI